MSISEVVQIQLHPEAYLPGNINSLIQNSVVFSDKELQEARLKQKKLYVLYSEEGEAAGFCVTTKAYPHEVAAELITDIKERVLWIDALEIKQEYQGRRLGARLFRHIRNSFEGHILLVSVAEAVPFWEKMGLRVMCWSGELAYMI